jgi:hypothetical protein
MDGFTGQWNETAKEDMTCYITRLSFLQERMQSNAVIPGAVWVSRALNIASKDVRL